MWTAIKLFGGKILGAIPWKVVIALAIAAGLFFGARYIINTINDQATTISTLQADKTKLTNANNELENRYTSHIAALEQTIKENQERTRDYDKAIRRVEGQTNTDCVINSPSIMESLRLRYERRYGLRSQ